VVEQFIARFTYVGLFLVLFAAGLGLPIPEEVAIIAGGALSHAQVARWWVALPVCVTGVLAGDVVLYAVGRHWGETILNWRAVRWVLSRKREEALTAAYHRHGAKVVFTARHVMGVRAAAFLTAGIVRIPFWKFLAVDALAACISVPLGFFLGYLATHQLERVLHDVHRVERWVAFALLATAAASFVYALWRSGRR
jgi:membrane protein DedA with SNARE-associated domain